MAVVFLSDSHLGNKLCQAGRLLRFLGEIPRETIYLVGDITDDLGDKPWPVDHVDALKLILSFKEIIWLPGNHDAAMRRLCGITGHLKVANEGFYFTRGRKYLVTHGDKYDPSLVLTIGPRWFNKLIYAKSNIAHTKVMSGFLERRVTKEALALGCDGVICGHTHRPANKTVGGIDYFNCGDWIESCTALIDRGENIELVAAAPNVSDYVGGGIGADSPHLPPNCDATARAW